LSPNIQAALYNANETDLLVGDPSFGNHPVVSVVQGAITNGSHFLVDNLVTAGTGPNPEAIANGTPFLTQLQNDLSALLDSQLEQQGDAPTITGVLNQEILARFTAALITTSTASMGHWTVPIGVIWLDPVSLGVKSPQGQQASYNLETNQVASNLPGTFISVGGNVEVIVLAGQAGTF